MSPQQETILHYLYTTGKPLTDYDCTTLLHICKLTTRVSELRADGWNIPHKKVKNETNNGHHNVYYMSANDMERYYARTLGV